MKEPFLTYKTAAGCKKLVCLFICCILVFSFIAFVFNTDGFTVKVQHITIDARGGALNGDLYYPVHTSEKDKLPAIIVAHGGGCAYGVTMGLSDELARRGFVVLNISAYGSGLSEKPESFDRSQGYLDVLAFVRTLAFVDQTRIGMTGHSMGGGRTSTTAVTDCGFLTYNDQMINVLADEFGQTFTEEEITKDADELAKERLAPEDLKLYAYRAAEVREHFDTRLKSICYMGNNGKNAIERQKVLVGGHEVTRNCQVNMGVVVGAYDDSYYNFASRDWAMDAWYTGTETVKLDTWFVLDDSKAESRQIGAFGDAAVAAGQEIQDAIANRMLRMTTLNLESHSKNYFSSATNADVCAYFCDTLRYNKGNYDDGSARPLSPTDQKWYWRAVCNGLSLLSMIGMIMALGGLLSRTAFFGATVAEKKTSAVPFSKKRYWLFSVLTVIATFIVIYCTTKGFMPNTLFNGLIRLTTNSWFPLFMSGWSAHKLLIYLAVSGILFIIVYAVIGRKLANDSGLKTLNVLIRFTAFLKTLLMSVILLIAGYASLGVVNYLFGQDFRFWQTQFPVMKNNLWAYVPSYALSYLPCFLIIGMAVNYTVRDDIPEWLDTLLTVIINSAGIWLCCLVNYFVLRSNTPGVTANYFATFITYYYTLLFVPINVYVTRRMFKITNSVWAGAIVNSLISAWSIIATVGL